jgi:hydrophobic/amphiphilic exporter-1 (mainly G- bacteria), HAE1 family
VVVVNTIQPGSSPEDMERDVSERIEAAVNTLSGVDELRSMSSEGISTVMIQFTLEKNVDVAAQEVQQKINTVLPELPRGIDPPVVMKFDPDAQPILYVALRAPDKDIGDITDLADRVVRRRIETVNGVGQAMVIGGRKRQINVSVDPVKLKGLGVSPLEVAAAINAQNITLPGGRVDVSRDYLSVRVQGRVQGLDELRAIIIRDSQGRSIRLDELANIEDGLEDVSSTAMWNGERTVLIAIRKQSGTNTVQVANDAKERLDEIQKELPQGYTLEVQRDGSAVIKTAADAVTEHLILGALFAAIVVLLFLGNFRSTIIAALAIPTSIIGTFALMKLQGYTLNSITLLALALAVGIVIDDAIVVLENIFRHVEEHGEDPKSAAIKGTKEIGLAVLATTLSLIAVFLPIAFIGGIPGRFLGPFGVTMAFSIAVSLFVSFTMTPSLASRWLKAHDPNAPRPLLSRLSDRFYRPIERAYTAMLKFSLAHRWVIVLAMVAAMASMVPLVKTAKKGFLPVDDRAQFEVLVRLPEGRSVASTELVGERVARIIRELPEVTATLLTIGDDAARTPNSARIYVKMVPPDQRVITQNDMKNLVREKILPTLPPDLRVTVADVNEFAGGQPTARVQYLLAGPDLKLLEQANKTVLDRIHKEAKGAVDVDSSMVVGKPELGVFVDRERAADLGVQVVDVAQALQYLVAGQKVSTYSERGEQYEVRLRATPDYRTNEDALRLITVPSRKLGLVTLADVVQVVRGEGPATISRFQRERQITFMANAGPGYGDGDVGDAVKAIIEDEASKLPPGFSAKPVGQTKIMKEVFLSFILGLLASFVFMYLILAAQFESWLHPVTILVGLPLTLPFAFASIILFGQAIDLYSFLGIFVLFGVVKKNAILQIDHSNQLREQGLPRLQAILTANQHRLRPILMTTFAFVAGMIPLVTAQGVGSGFSRATAGVVVGGQVMSLLLTLLAVPVVYTFFDDIALWIRKLRGAAPTAAARSTPAPSHEPVGASK